MNNSSRDAIVILRISDDFRVAPVVVAAGGIVVAYIIIANSVLIACFVINRPSTWNGFTRQVFNLAISDLLVGLTGVPPLITSCINRATPYTSCAGHFYMFFSAQHGTLFHVLAICLQRTIMLKNIGHSDATESSSTRNTIILISAWLISLIVCVVPFLLWGRQDQYSQICVVHVIFGHNYKQAMTVIFLLYLLPLLATDILYTCAIIDLYCKIYPMIFPAPVSDEYPTTGNPSSTGQDTVMSIRYQRQVFGTIGILLLLLNVFTLPMIIIILLEQMQIPMHINIRWFVSILFMFNSAVNPAVYAIRIKTLNANLKKMFRTCWSMIG